MNYVFEENNLLLLLLLGYYKDNSFVGCHFAYAETDSSREWWPMQTV